MVESYLSVTLRKGYCDCSHFADVHFYCMQLVMVIYLVWMHILANFVQALARYLGQSPNLSETVYSSIVLRDCIR